VNATALRVEYREEPLGIDERAPRFSWAVTSDRRADGQTACRIVVSSTPDGGGDLWDSGRVPSSQTSQIAYAGQPLRSAQRCWWTVEVWDGEGQSDGPSEATWFETGLLDPADWQGQWITAAAPAPDQKPIDIGEWDGGYRPMVFRKTFTAEAADPNARLSISALGIYDARINGEPVTEDRLRPGWTDYRRRIPYQVYDVAPLLTPGENVIEVTLADGWYAGRLAWLDKVYGERPQLLAQLSIDGQTVATDATWESAPSSLLWASLLMGEVEDRRLFAQPPQWGPVELAPAPEAPLTAHPAPPVRVLQTLTPISVTQVEPGRAIVDMGQNMVGVVRLRLRGAASATVVLRHAEILDTDGSQYTTNLRKALCTDAVVLGPDDADVVFEPRFTFHGFRYVEVSGLPHDLDAGDVAGVVLGSDTPQAGGFTCSNPMVNQLQRNIEWGQRGNFLEVPTDCPQRDERLGWMGDAQIFIGTACWNADVSAFFTKWVQDVLDARSDLGAFADVSPVVYESHFGNASAGWGDAGVIVPWRLYERYGDERVLAQSFEAMVSWVAYLREANLDLLWRQRRGMDYGDWLSIQADTPKDVLATAYFAHSADLTARAARVLGRKEEAEQHEQLFADIKAAFNHAYVTPAGRIVGHTQTAYVLALAFDLLPEALRPAAIDFLVEDIEAKDGHLSTGFLGVGHLLPTLTAHDRLDVAYRLLENDTFPSWGYSIKHGATTIWERWDGWTEDKGFQTPTMNSFNHYSLGSVGDWLFQAVAGIRPDPAAPGFERFAIRPQPGGSLTWAEAWHDSIKGRIASAWRTGPGGFELDVTVPANTQCEVWVPAPSTQSVEAPEGAEWQRHEDGAAVFAVGGGTYRFRVPESA
jgi:alpha-L-rhamnosidase